MVRLYLNRQDNCPELSSEFNKNSDHFCPVKRIPAGDLEQAVIAQLAGLFQAPTILRETLKAVRQKEELLRNNCERDCKMLQEHLDELKKQSLKEEIDYDEVKKAATKLTEARHNLSLLREPTTEEDIIAGLGDAAGLWEFMFPGARQELIQL